MRDRAPYIKTSRRLKPILSNEVGVMERRQSQLAVVTGAGSGIGAAIATKLLEQCFEVVALDLKFDGLCESSEKFHKIKCDLSSEKEVDEAWDKITCLGPVHVLVNNAGVTDYSPIIGK